MRDQINAALLEAFTIGKTSGEIVQQTRDLHQQWRRLFRKGDTYFPAAHLALAGGYVAAERFSAYYEAIVTDSSSHFPT